MAGRANCNQPQFQEARHALGAEVLKYVMILERPNTRVSGIDEQIYMGDSSRVPLWPYKDANGNQRSQYSNTMLTDVRVGSPWVNYIVDYVGNLATEGKFDGLFLDGQGGRLWGAAGWDSWPANERAEWTAGMVDLQKRLRAAAPNLILVCNNHWDNVTSTGVELACNGTVAENHPITNLAIQRILGKPYGTPRRVLRISPTSLEAQNWLNVPGITHLAITEGNANKYSYPSGPAAGVDYLDPTILLKAKITKLEQEKALLESTIVGLQDTVTRTASERDLAMARIDQILSRLADVQALLDSI
jgi:uncharacterized coiled-coil protein SlyX